MISTFSDVNRRLRGSNRRRGPPIGKSVSGSCRVRIVRTNEAKLRGRVGGECLSTLGIRMVRCTPGRGCVLCLFAALCKGFEENAQILLLCARVLKNMCSTFACLVAA